MDHAQAMTIASGIHGANLRASMLGRGYRVDYTSADGRYHSVESEGADLIDYEYKSVNVFLAWGCDGVQHGLVSRKPFQTA